MTTSEPLSPSVPNGAVASDMALIPILYDSVMNKRTRSDSNESFSELVSQLLALCVKYRKSKYLKEVLHQFRNVCLYQQSGSNATSSVAEMEQVFKALLKDVSQRVLQAAEQEEKNSSSKSAVANKVEDLEEAESPESLLMKTVMSSVEAGGKSALISSGDVQQDDTLTHWLRFLWETYRTVLDLLKSQARLEELYVEVAKSALNFCLIHKRKNEFRRLCEILRSHLATVLKYSGSSSGNAASQNINLMAGSSLQTHLDLRFSQLKVASDLELWQEAFRLVDDIHALFTGNGQVNPMVTVNGIIISSKRMNLLKSPAVMMADFYERLAHIFLVSDNYLFHARALMSLYTVLETSEDPLLKEKYSIAQVADSVILAVLTVPFGSKAISTYHLHGELDESRKYRPLLGLLGLGSLPTRVSLMKDIQVKNLLDHVSCSEVKDIFQYLEISFYPLTIGKKMEPLFAKLISSGHLKNYSEPLYHVMLIRLLQQLGSVYECMKLEKLYALAHVNVPFSLSPVQLEKFILLGWRRGEFTVQFDHANRVINFKNPAAVESTSALPFVDKLNDFCRKVSKINISNAPSESGKDSDRILKLTASAMALEREALLERRKYIEKRKERMEAEALEKEKAAEKERIAQVEAEIEAERTRQREEMERRERERMEQELRDLEREESQKMLLEIKKSREAQGLEFDEKEFEGLGKTELLQKHYERLAAEKKQMEERLAGIATYQDHLERAIRQEEKPLRVAHYKEALEKDREKFHLQQKEQVTQVIENHKKDVAKRESLLKITKLSDKFTSFMDSIVNKRKEAINEIKDKMKNELERAKEERISAARLERKKELYESRLAEQQKEEEERLEREKKEEKAKKLVKEMAEAAERNARLDEIARKQREKELEIEAREKREREERMQQQQQQQSGSRMVPSASSTSSEGGAWRVAGSARKNAAFGNTNRASPFANSAGSANNSGKSSPAPVAAAATPAAPATQKYVPPKLRKTEDSSRSGGSSSTASSRGFANNKSGGGAGGSWRRD